MIPGDINTREDAYLRSLANIDQALWCFWLNHHYCWLLNTIIYASNMSRHTSPEKTTPPFSTGGTPQPRSLDPIQSSNDAEFTLVTRLTQGLEGCDWDQLQERYVDAMDEHSRVEDDLRAETARLLEV